MKLILQAIDSLHTCLKREAGFRYTVLSHQSCHGVSHQTAHSDLQKLSARELLIAGKDGRREIFRVPFSQGWAAFGAVLERHLVLAPAVGLGHRATDSGLETVQFDA